MSLLLHEENLGKFPIFGGMITRALGQRATEVVNDTQGQSDPSVSIVIRSRNESPKLEKLLQDITLQQFDGAREILVVDSESTDDTRPMARSYGAEVISIAQRDFSYPLALNRGFEAASYPYIFSFVGHSLLTNTCVLRTVTRWEGAENFAGAYGVALPNDNATWTERVGALLLGVGKFVATPANKMTEGGMGVLASNCSLVVRDAWEEAGRYDESYGAGGEDGALANTFLKNGLSIIREPALSVYHTHGLGPINGLKQLLAWRAMSDPRPFNQEETFRRRPDLA